MKILEIYPEVMSTVDRYRLTHSGGKMRELKGQRIEVEAYAVYQETGDTGEATVLAIKTPENEVFATNSSTFIRDFRELADFFQSEGEPIPSIKIISGTSRNNREFITCAPA